MAATFYSLTSGDIFSSGGGATHLISIPSVDSIVTPTGIAIYDNVTIQVGETIQYFLTFDDVIKYIHFGKGVGSVTAEGTMYSDCIGNLPGLSRFTSAVSALRGQTTTISLGGAGFTVVMTQASISITGEPLTSAKFNFTFSIVNHGL